MRADRAGKAVRVVSLPSWAIFEKQTQEYKDSVLPPAVTKRVAVEAGIRLGWERYTTTGGKFVDNSFAVPGASGCTLNVGSAHIDIDKYIDQAAALPSPAGHSSATLGFSLSVVSPTAVYPAS